MQGTLDTIDCDEEMKSEDRNQHKNSSDSFGILDWFQMRIVPKFLNEHIEDHQHKKKIYLNLFQYKKAIKLHLQNFLEHLLKLV